MNFNNVKAVITGGLSGLGKATSDLIIKNGGRVVIFDLDESNNSKIKTLYKNNYTIFYGDVTKEDDINKCFKFACDKFREVNLVVNCAGIGVAEKLIGKEGLHSIALFQKVINVNLFGTFNVIRSALKEMKNNSVDNDGLRGVIINTSSIAAYDGQIGQVAYSASKGAIVSITLPMARELARYGIRVCTIAPGLFETPMLTGLPEKAQSKLVESTLLPRRLGKPEEYANLVKSIFENNMLNGETIRLDGSIRLSPK